MEVGEKVEILIIKIEIIWIIPLADGTYKEPSIDLILLLSVVKLMKISTEIEHTEQKDNHLVMEKEWWTSGQGPTLLSFKLEERN